MTTPETLLAKLVGFDTTSSKSNRACIDFIRDYLDALKIKSEIVANDDGTVIMAPLDGRMEIVINPPMSAQGAAVTGLVWNAGGDCLFAALENGELLLFTVESVGRAARRT